jgi:hypothetical protein
MDGRAGQDDRYLVLAGGDPERDPQGLVGSMGATGVLRDKDQDGERLVHAIS